MNNTIIDIKTKIHNTYDYTLNHIDGSSRHYQSTNAITPYFRECILKLIRPTTLLIGKGTGTVPNATNTLFSYLLGQEPSSNIDTIIEKTADRLYYKSTLTFIIGASKYKGPITEVGISIGTSSSNQLVSHSLITDSEGVPITINKTDLETLTIVATLYVDLQFTTEDPLFTINKALANCFVGTLSYRGYSIQRALKLRQNTSAWTDFSNVGSDLSASSKAIFTTPGGTTEAYNNDTGALVFSKPVARVTNIDNNEANFGRGAEAKYVALDFYGFKDLYSPRPYKKYTLGTGDALTKSFWIGTPRFIKDTEKVYIDGVLKVRGIDYNTHDKNALMFPSVAASSDGSRLTQVGPYTSSSSAASPLYPSPLQNGYVSQYLDNYSIAMSTTSPYTWDFKDPITVNAIGTNIACTASLKHKIQYSDDNIVWQDYIDFEASTRFDSVLANNPYIKIGNDYHICTDIRINDASLEYKGIKLYNNGTSYSTTPITAWTVITYSALATTNSNRLYTILQTFNNIKGFSLNATLVDDSKDLFKQGFKEGMALVFAHEATGRYWRWLGNEAPSPSNLAWPDLSFGYIKPSITFVVPPAQNSVIEIEYDIPYAFKNSNTVIDWSASFTLGG